MDLQQPAAVDGQLRWLGLGVTRRVATRRTPASGIALHPAAALVGLPSGDWMVATHFGAGW